MANFATTYRPQKFSDVVGQEIVIKALKSVAHADGIAVRSIFIKGAWGAGKCVLGHTRVATSIGYQKIESLLKGNVGFNEYITDVYTRLGKYKSSHWYKELNCLVINHRLSNGYTINGTADHRVLAWHDNRVDLHRMGDLVIGDTILFPKCQIGENWQHDPKLAYVTGLWLGDGFYHKGMGFCGTHEMCTKFAELSGWHGAITKDKRRKDLYTVRALKSDNSLISLKGHSATKEIPEYIFSMDIDSRISFIQGLLETDGFISTKGDIEWTMNSEVLIKQLQELLFTLGVSARVVSKVSTCGEYKGITWRLRIPANQSCFELKKNGRTWSHVDSMNDRNILHLNDSSFVVSAIRKHRVNFDKRYKSDIGVKTASNVRVWSAITERTLIKYQEFFGELPPELRGLIGYNYEQIVDTSYTNADVYDLTVPEVHEFYCQGTYNHNTTTARIFSRALNCSRFKELDDVCNECDGCKETLSSNSQLYFEFDSSVVGNVDAIRNLQEKLAYAPTSGRRLVVFDECHSASKQALNAMLKMIEDGVPNTMFLFASTEDILSTIKSRSLCLDVTPIPFDLISQRLRWVADQEHMSISDESIETLSVKSNGHMRDALSLLQLYSVIGEAALSTSYQLISKFYRAACSKRADIAEQLIPQILAYPIVDIKSSIYRFIKNCYVSEQGDELFPFQQVISKIYNFTFSQVSQYALNDEVGIELYFRSFLEKLK